ncbi:MAG: HI0074 family nucleotidyltransferase substrate-binding subunit [Elusimicrobia bacterium]|nr:HI0074 family nucleotidyltransferase substrate-binding subunit [Elusimicrobiota bacterium]
MSNKWRAQLKQFEQAVLRLQEVLQLPKNSVVRDSSIQRFEFCCELSWKVLKLFLAEQGVVTSFPKETIREAFARGLLENDLFWIRTIDLRILSSHTYNELLADEIYNELTGALPMFQKLVKRLSEYRTEDGPKTS